MRDGDVRVELILAQPVAARCVGRASEEYVLDRREHRVLLRGRQVARRRARHPRDDSGRDLFVAFRGELARRRGNESFGREARVANEIPQRTPQHGAKKCVVDLADVRLEPRRAPLIEHDEAVGVVVRVGKYKVRGRRTRCGGNHRRLGANVDGDEARRRAVRPEHELRAHWPYTSAG